MKTIYKFLLAFVCVLSLSASSFAQTAVKTMPIGGETGITGTGIVRVVVKTTDKFVSHDVGVIIHQEEANYAYNNGMALALFQYTAGEPVMAQLRGWNPNAWNLTSVKNFPRGTQVALWFSIDAVNNTYSIACQGEGETTVTTLVENFGSRASHNSLPSDAAKFLTVGYNKNNGSADWVQVVDDAVVVSAIEPFLFVTSAKTTSHNAMSLKLYPTVADDFLNIVSEEEISSVKVISMVGKTVYEGNAVSKISVSDLQAGAYIVEVKTINNNIARKNFMKK